MAEPQPAEVHEGAADPHAPTSTAEDRKAAAALSTLDTQEDTAEKKEIDSKALDKAMKGLNVNDNKGEEKKTVKVEAADVNLLVSGRPCSNTNPVIVEVDKKQVSELEVSKQKATELLRANDGDAAKAMIAFVTASP
jgi:outer membrane receptor for ferrienterochelin and colicin